MAKNSFVAEVTFSIFLKRFQCLFNSVNVYWNRAPVQRHFRIQCINYFVDPD